MAKKKSKFKKFLKSVAPLAIAGLGAAMLGNRRRNQANVELDLPKSVMPSAKSLMTSDRAYTGSGYDDPIMKGGKGAVIPNNLPVTSANVQRGLVEAPFTTMKRNNRRINFVLDGYASFKKGGRVGCGVAKRGFGKAMKKEKK